jgi:hypothetical protein
LPPPLPPTPTAARSGAQSALPPIAAPAPAPTLRPVSHEVAVTAPQAPAPLPSAYAQAPQRRVAPSPAPVQPAPLPEVADLIAMLDQCSLAENRERAALQFSRVDWRANPKAVEALSKAARGDAAAPVRLACVGALERMNADTPDAVTTLCVVAATDDDARVRDAARRAVAKFKTGQPAATGKAAPR